ncbi:YybH family protein [Methylosarcina fibrata]|uniref:YybH family protein n=1 Tax=Methylosarcina fibrata TaxID=105972 RepID=UPI0003681F29|nr:nuclear transport factor 2 family protein [Methylosarcina fibrata]
MAIIYRDFAVEFARHWIAAWNRHDLDEVLSHYADDITLFSPCIISIAEEPSGILCGKEEIRAYWRKGLALVPDLHFELHDVLTGVNCLTIYYQGHAGRVAETFRLDESGKVTEAYACYTVPPGFEANSCNSCD